MNVLPEPRPRSFGGQARLLLAACGLACAGCATMKMPSMPWLEKQAKDAAAATDDSTVISSELSPEEQELGWDYFKGENVKKRWKKLVGRGPNEPVARTSLAEADALFPRAATARRSRSTRWRSTAGPTR